MKQIQKLIAIVGGGALTKSLLPRIRKAGYVIGVDRGAYWLLRNGVASDVAIGDFDSVTASEFKKIQKHVKSVVRHPAQKDATDLELAVEYACKRKPKEVAIFGAIGTRFDHTWAGTHLLARLSSHNIYGYIVDNFNEIHIVRRLLKLEPSKIFPYTSIFPLNGKATVTLTGFRYNVTRRVFELGSTLGVSNEIVSVAIVVVHQGAVLLMRSRD